MDRIQEALNKMPRADKQRGQGMVEYIIIVALIALAAIGAFTFFGETIRGQTAQMAAQVAGSESTTGSTEASSGSSSADSEATAQYDLSNFSDADGGSNGGGGGD